MANGEFTPSQLMELRLKAETSWTGTAFELSKTKNVEAAKAVLENQTARFSGFDDPDKDRKVKVMWINSCGTEVEDCEDNCALDEQELSTAMKEYEPDLCKKTGFAIDEEKLRTNEYNMEELIVAGTTDQLGKLDEWLAQTTLAKLKTFAGVNTYPAPWTYDNPNKTTHIPNADWGLKAIPHILNQMTLNNMGDTYFLNNGSLFIDFYNAMINEGNLDGKGNATIIKQLKMYFDQINFGKAGLTDDLFAINKNAVALKTVNRHHDVPRVIGGKVGQTRYTIKSPNLAGVKYDAYYELTCKTVGGKDHLFHTWRFVVNGLVALNPTGCPITVSIGGIPTTVSQTGVLSYSNP